MSTGFVWHELYMWHNNGMSVAYYYPNPKDFLEPGLNHFESPSTKRRFYNLLTASNFIEQLTTIKPRHATDEDVLLFHTSDYLQKVKAISNTERGGEVSPLVIVSPGSYEIALLSLGGCLEALDKIMSQQVRNAYALVRPPGHHAESDKGMGYCVFGNVAITAMYAKKKYNLKRIAVVDWDVHHGNGTQKAFYNDPSVLFISIHQNKNFPIDTGMVEENGEGSGEGFNINIPLPPGSGFGAYDYAFDEVVVPALNIYKPELILVSSGFDACFMDPQGSMLLSSTDFRNMTRLVKIAADKHCQGRLLIAHEGGYSNEQVPFCGVAVVEELSGKDSGINDPFSAEIRLMGDQELQSHQEKRVQQSVALLTKLKENTAKIFGAI
jgi:acetoin utilization deacetylase AcuC-like enzyme